MYSQRSGRSHRTDSLYTQLRALWLTIELAANLRVGPSSSTGCQIKMPQLLETDDRCHSQAQIKLMRRHYLSTTEQSAAECTSSLLLLPARHTVGRTGTAAAFGQRYLDFHTDFALCEYKTIYVVSLLINERCCDGSKYNLHDPMKLLLQNSCVSFGTLIKHLQKDLRLLLYNCSSVIYSCCR